MARINKPYGKDDPERFIDEALDGGGAQGHDTPKGFQNSRTSDEMVETSIDRRNQSILTSFALDNVGEVYDRYPTSMKRTDLAGGVDNLKHSLTGASAVNEEVGAAGEVKHIIIPNH